MTTLLEPWAFDAMTEVDSAPGWDSRAKLETLETEQVAEALLAFIACGFPDEGVACEEVLSERRRGGPPLDRGEIADAAEVARAWRERPFDGAAESAPLAVVSKPEALLRPDGWPVGVRWANLAEAAVEPPPVADLLPVAGTEAGLIYSSRTCWVSGAGGTGKTWLAIQAATEAIDAGRRVLWIDGDDTAATFAQRLYDIGAGDLTRAPDLLRWIGAGDWQESNDLERQAAADWTGGGLVVVDTATNTGAGQSEDSFMAWAEVHLLPGGHGTLVVDHVRRRNTDDDGRRFAGPIGSVAKIGRATGSMLHVAGEPWTDHHPGALRISYDKDRPGGLGVLGRRGEPVAVIVGRSGDDGILRLEARPHGGERTEAAGELIERMLAMVGARPGTNSRGLEAELPGHPQKAVRAARDMLIRQGRVVVVDGPNRQHRHYVPEAVPEGLGEAATLLEPVGASQVRQQIRGLGASAGASGCVTGASPGETQ